MNKKYKLDEKPTTLSEIKARPGVGNVRFDPDARDENGDIDIEGWTICNAVRPIPGTISWTDADTFPVFWAAIDTQGNYGPEYLERCEELDASEVVYVTEDEVRQDVQAYYDDKMPGRVDVAEYKIQDVLKAYLRIKRKEI